MKTKTIKIDFSRAASAYEIVIGSDLLAGGGAWARKCLGGDASKIALVSNPTVFKLYGKQIELSLAAAGFEVSRFLMKDGERHKTLRSAEAALDSFSELQLSRTDAVVALGGGVVGDLAGFASAVYLRGVRFLQIPTTLLSMIDSSVGGKTGVNSAHGKNLIGAFHQPSGVLIDTATLRSLPKREITAALCEAVKQSAVSGKKLLSQTDDFLATYPQDEWAAFADDSTFQARLRDFIASHVAYKAKIVAGDEREISTRIDSKSRKVLNFGHTLAHGLEKVTSYKHLKHGEAVGYGIMFAAELSKRLALCDEKDVKLLNDVLHRVGSLPRLGNIDENKVLTAFGFDKKNLGGSLQMVLLRGIGRPVIASEKEIPRSALRNVLSHLLQKWA